MVSRISFDQRVTQSASAALLLAQLLSLKDMAAAACTTARRTGQAMDAGLAMGATRVRRARPARGAVSQGPVRLGEATPALPRVAGEMTCMMKQTQRDQVHMVGFSELYNFSIILYVL